VSVPADTGSVNKTPATMNPTGAINSNTGIMNTITGMTGTVGIAVGNIVTGTNIHGFTNPRISSHPGIAVGGITVLNLLGAVVVALGAWIALKVEVHGIKTKLDMIYAGHAALRRAGHRLRAPQDPLCPVPRRFQPQHPQHPLFLRGLRLFSGAQQRGLVAARVSGLTPCHH
jgi:hypothetical protein